MPPDVLVIRVQEAKGPQMPEHVVDALKAVVNEAKAHPLIESQSSTNYTPMENALENIATIARSHEGGLAEQIAKTVEIGRSRADSWNSRYLDRRTALETLGHLLDGAQMGDRQRALRASSAIAKYALDHAESRPPSSSSPWNTNLYAGARQVKSLLGPYSSPDAKAASSMASDFLSQGSGTYYEAVARGKSTMETIRRLLG